MDPIFSMQPALDGVTAGNPTWAVIVVVAVILYMVKDIAKFVWERKEDRAAQDRRESSEASMVQLNKELVNGIKELQRAETEQTRAITAMTTAITALSSRAELNYVKTGTALEEVRRDFDRLEKKVSNDFDRLESKVASQKAAS